MRFLNLAELSGLTLAVAAVLVLAVDCGVVVSFLGTILATALLWAARQRALLA